MGIAAHAIPQSLSTHGMKSKGTKSRFIYIVDLSQKVEKVSSLWVTFRSCYEIGVDFDKICVFCSKCCVCSDKYVSIVIKIKCANFGNTSDICNKFNLL